MYFKPLVNVSLSVCVGVSQVSRCWNEKVRIYKLSSDPAVNPFSLKYLQNKSISIFNKYFLLCRRFEIWNSVLYIEIQYYHSICSGATVVYSYKLGFNLILHFFQSSFKVHSTTCLPKFLNTLSKRCQNPVKNPLSNLERVFAQNTVSGLIGDKNTYCGVDDSNFIQRIFAEEKTTHNIWKPVLYIQKNTVNNQGWKPLVVVLKSLENQIGSSVKLPSTRKLQNCMKLYTPTSEDPGSQRQWKIGHIWYYILKE